MSRSRIRAKRFTSLILSFLLVAPAWATEQELLILRSEAEIADAMTLDVAVRVISSKVTACLNNKRGELVDCQCAIYDEFLALEKSYTFVIEKYPTWKGEQIQIPLEGSQATLNMAAVEEALNGIKCKK